MSEVAWRSWDAFVRDNSHTGFMQTSWWAEFRLNAGFEHFGIVLRDDAAIVGGAIVFRYAFEEGLCFYYVPEGPVVPSDNEAGAEVFSAIVAASEAARDNDRGTVSHLRIEPRWTSVPYYVDAFERQPEFVDPYVEPRNTRCLHVAQSDECLLAAMKAKGRYNVKVAARRGVRVEKGDLITDLPDFLELYTETTQRQGLDPKPAAYFENLAASLTRADAGAVHFAVLGGERVAGAIVVYFGPRATYLFGASRHDTRHAMAPYLLHFEIMREARSRGCSWYDLWGCPAEDQPDHPWARLGQFKRKFGGYHVSLAPTLDHVFDRHAYAQYSRLHRPTPR